jgi:hypothetical protein
VVPLAVVRWPHRYPLSVLVGGHHDVIGEQAAGAVVLGAVQHVALAVGGEHGAVAVHRADAWLGDCIADQRAVRDCAQPPLTLFRIGGKSLVLDEPPMHPQGLRQVRLRGGQVDQQPELLAHADAEPAEPGRHPQRGEARLAQPAHLGVRQPAIDLPLHRALGDPFEDRAEPSVQFRVRDRRAVGGDAVGGDGHRCPHSRAG